MRRRSDPATCRTLRIDADTGAVVWHRELLNDDEAFCHPILGGDLEIAADVVGEDGDGEHACSRRPNGH